MWKWSDLKRLLRLRKAADFSDSAAIMWPVLPAENLFTPNGPHATVIYLGNISESNFTKEQVIEAIKQTAYDVFVWATVTGLDWFGPEENIPVLRIQNPFLPAYRDSLKKALTDAGVVWEDRFPEFKPHVTITDESALNGVWPEKILLLPVELWWGGEHIKIAPDLIIPTRTAL